MVIGLDVDPGGAVDMRLAIAWGGILLLFGTGICCICLGKVTPGGGIEEVCCFICGLGAAVVVLIGVGTGIGAGTEACTIRETGAGADNGVGTGLF